MVKNGRERRGLALALLLAGCGGGGGDPTAGPGPTPPPAAVVEDILPLGERLTVGAAEFMPLALGADWRYDRVIWSSGQEWSRAQVLAVPTSASGARLETIGEGAGAPVQFLWTDRGWEIDARVHFGLPSAAADPGRLLVYPRLFPGQTERGGPSNSSIQTRRGTLGVDVDGDGIVDDYQITLGQGFGGMVNVQGPQGLVRAYQIGHQLQLSYKESKLGITTARLTENWTDWLVEGVGPVMVKRSALIVGGLGAHPDLEWRLRTATVGGTNPLPAEPLSDVTRLGIPTLDVVPDPARGVYYATLPASDLQCPGCLATLDPVTKRITASRLVGALPSTLAVAADGQSLYVALDGSRELLRLALPSMAELARTPLPESEGEGLTATTIAASPTDPDTVAIAIGHRTFFAGHVGIAVWRAGAFLPQWAKLQRDAAQITFAADGASVLALYPGPNFGMHRYELRPDGLLAAAIGPQPPSALGYYSTRWEPLSRFAGGLVHGYDLFGVDLQHLGRVARGSQCQPMGAQALACLAMPGSDAVMVLDAGTLAVRVVLPVETPAGVITSRLIVPGLPGQLLIRDEMSTTRSDGARFLLMMESRYLR